jgi:hypothetical protein
MLIDPAWDSFLGKEHDAQTLPVSSTAAMKFSLPETIFICTSLRPGHDTLDKNGTLSFLLMPSWPAVLSPHARRDMSLVMTANVRLPHESMLPQRSVYCRHFVR